MKLLTCSGHSTVALGELCSTTPLKGSVKTDRGPLRSEGQNHFRLDQFRRDSVRQHRFNSRVCNNLSSGVESEIKNKKL